MCAAMMCVHSKEVRRRTYITHKLVRRTRSKKRHCIAALLVWPAVFPIMFMYLVARHMERGVLVLLATLDYSIEQGCLWLSCMPSASKSWKQLLSL